jgi:hypothetical protein
MISAPADILAFSMLLPFRVFRVVRGFSSLQVRLHFFCEKLPGLFGGHVMFLPAYHNRHPGDMAGFHTEAGLKADFVVEGFFLYKLLEGLDEIIGPLEVAGASDTNGEIKHGVLLFLCNPRAAIREPGL